MPILLLAFLAASPPTEPDVVEYVVKGTGLGGGAGLIVGATSSVALAAAILAPAALTPGAGDDLGAGEAAGLTIVFVTPLATIAGGIAGAVLGAMTGYAAATEEERAPTSVLSSNLEANVRPTELVCLAPVAAPTSSVPR